MRYGTGVTLLFVTLVSCGGGGGSGGGPALAPSQTSTVAPSSGSGPTAATSSSSRGPWNTQNSGKLNAVAVDPDNTAIMYVAGGVGTADSVTTDAGVFATPNGGKSWQFADSGLGDTTVNSLLIDATGGLDAATEAGGIYRSTNGAQSWTQTSTALGVRQLIISGGILYAAAQQGVWQSSTGASWSLVVSTEAAANAIASNGTSLYVGLVDGTLLRIDASGSSTVVTQFPELETAPIVHSIAIDPNDVSSIYVTLSGMVNDAFSDALYHSSDAGATWSQVSIPPSLRGAQAIAFSSVTPHLLFVAGTGLAETSDGVNLQLGSGYGDARTITVLPQDRLVIAADQGVGVGTFSSGFASITAGLAINIVRTVAIDGSTLVATMQDFGPAISVNGGSTWSSIPNDAQEDGVAYVNPNNANLCYMLDTTLYVSSNGCTSFTTASTGSLAGSNEPFATVAGSSTTYVSTENGIWVASDGLHFAQANWSVPDPVDIAVDPRSAAIYISSATGAVTVWYSHNGGRTFAQSQPLDPPGAYYPGDAPVLAVDPSNGDVLAATETALYRSTNGGATFTALSQTEQPDASERVRRAVKARRDPDADSDNDGGSEYNINERAAFVSTPSGAMFVLSISDGLFASFDDGSTLQPLDFNTISHAFEGFTTDSTGDLCVGTDGEGIVCSPLSALAQAAEQARGRR
jgi:ligand-binding sensor domain-containing protein